MEELFKPILDDDEIIVKEYKPNKLKYYFTYLLGVVITLAVFSLGLAFFLFVPDKGATTAYPPIYCLIPISIFVVGIALSVWLIMLAYKKANYVVTNKRVIIRTGAIGVDFKSLDMAMIGAIDVNVSLLDKVLGKDTGTIRFGSASSPIGGQTSNSYIFKHVKSPYNTCKEIKTYIDEYKQQKQQSKQAEN